MHSSKNENKYLIAKVNLLLKQAESFARKLQFSSLW